MFFRHCRRLATIPLGAAALLLSAYLIKAEPTTFPELLEHAKQAEARGSNTEAELSFQKALSLLKNPEIRDAVVLWNDLGHVHQKQRRFNDAEHDFLTALEINARLKEPDLEEKASSLNNLGALSMRQGNLQRAEERLQQALAVVNSAGLSNSPISGPVLQNLGQICFKQHKYEAAREYYAKAENIISRAPGQGSIEYAKLLIAAGLLSFETGDYADAMAKDKLAVEIQSQLPAVAPGDKATAENNVAAVFMRLGDTPKAEQLLIDAVKLYKLDSGGSDLRLVEALNSLASTQVQLDKLDAAKEHADEAFTLAVQLAGKGSEQAAKIHNTLGCLDLREKKWGAARAEFEQALDLWVGPPPHKLRSRGP
jgi:tetratricopeptide (TPR) repeat protein